VTGIGKELAEKIYAALSISVIPGLETMS
jgi:hypothetical protein